jgi:hypothetical protein
VAGHKRGVSQLCRRFLEKHQGWALLTQEGVEIWRQARIALFVDVPTNDGEAVGERTLLGLERQ